MERVINYLKEKGIKITKPREKVLNILTKSSKPLSLNEIHQKIEDVDFASVFRNIKLFNEIGLVAGIRMGDRKTRYELITAKHYHHIICSNCGKIERLDVCFLSKIEKLTEFKIENHHMEFIGLCPKCKK